MPWSFNGTVSPRGGRCPRRTTSGPSTLRRIFPPGLSLVLEIFASGVTFDDGTRTKALTAADFDENGLCRVRFVKARGVVSSVCHRTRIYQNGTLIYTNGE